MRKFLEKAKEFIKEIGSPLTYRIYCHEWKVVPKDGDGDWDYDERWYPTLFVSTNYAKALWMSYDLNLNYKENGVDGWIRSFRVEIDEDEEYGRVTI